MNKIRGHIVDIYQKSVFTGEITIEGDRIHSIRRCSVVPDRFILPGFIDAHVHVESSMLIPSEFARMAVKHGTVATVSDPHEIGNVLGVKGVKYMIENGNKTPFKFYFGVPSCVPATAFETAGATIGVEEVEELFQISKVHYLAEMMNYPGVLNGDPEVFAKIELAKKYRKRVDGHAPGLRGKEVEKYAAAGIETDHECFTKAEALDKLKAGMKILIREGSAAKNFEALWTLIDEFPDKIMFCSDDKHPNDFVLGHINKLAARAIAKGCNLFNVLQAACVNPISHYNMDVGTLRVGDKADFCILQDLEHFEVLTTFIDGVATFKEGEVRFPRIVEENILNNFTSPPVEKQELRISAQSEYVRVIVVEDGQLVTGETRAQLAIEEGALQPDVENDILKLAVVNRYREAAPGLAFIKNFNLKKGAIASCVAHDSHNIIAVGTNDTDLQRAINRVVKSKGGIALANGDQVEVLPLPVAGIMSADTAESVARRYEEMDRMAKTLGTRLRAPYMTLAFCALLVIPQLKLSDKGLFDGKNFEFVSLTVPAPEETF